MMRTVLHDLPDLLTHVVLSNRVMHTDRTATVQQIANQYRQNGTTLQYQNEVGGAKRLLYGFLDPELAEVNPRFRKFRANRSMRDVEPEVNLWLRSLDNISLEDGEDG